MAIILSSGLPWQPRRRQISCRSAHCYLLLLLMPNLLLQPPTLLPTHYHYNIVPTTYYLQDQPTISLLALLLMHYLLLPKHKSVVVLVSQKSIHQFTPIHFCQKLGDICVKKSQGKIQPTTFC